MIDRPTGTIVATCMAASMTFTGFTVAKALGMPWPGLNLLFSVLGVMMIVMGNAAGKFPPNHMLGFRSHWALDDEDIWGKTQRFAGWVMVIAGFVILDSSLVFDLATVNWITLVAACGSSLLITFTSQRFARQKRKARDAVWRALTG